jgi:subtilisin-like proprotein convertase family protein
MRSARIVSPARRAAIGLVVTAGAVLTCALAATAPETDLRFEDLVRPREGAVIAVAPTRIDDLAPADPLRAGWEDFRAQNEGEWKIYLDARSAMPTLVSGRGVALFAAEDLESASLEDVEAKVRAFLDGERDLIGDWRTILQLDRDASAKLRAGHWQLVFRQVVDGVVIENSRLDCHVVNGRLTMFGASNWGTPAVSGVPVLNAGDARDFLDAYLGVETGGFQAVGEPALVMVARDPDPSPDRPRKWSGARGAGLTHRLIWRLRFRDPAAPALWVGEIDANDGTVLAFFDDARYHSIHGGIYPEAPDVGCVSGGCEIEAFPMPFADWTESGQASAFADEYGNLECSDPDAAFETTLEGPYAIVDDTCGPVLETGSCADGLRLGLKAGENCEVAPGASPGNTAAARSAYYHVNRVAEVARFYNPSNTYLNNPVTVNTNWDQTCNASYGGGGIYLYRSGTSWAECANTGEIQGIVVHEWGHGYDQNDGGDWDFTSEAYGDVVAMLASRQSCFGPGLFLDGRTCAAFGDTCLTCTGFRDHDWAARILNTPATPQDFVANRCMETTGDSPCGGQVHCESYPIDESIFDLATRDLPASGMDVDSAWQLVERLWYSTRAGSGGNIYNCALPDSDSCGATSWYQRMRVADDDDGDLSNGTPHAAALYAAFARHNIACGLPDDPENQSTSSCPVLATPELTVVEGGSGPELSWTDVPGAAEYQLYRGDLGCDKQHVPVAALPAGVTTWIDIVPDPGIARFYRVEAIGTNPVCRSAVSSCEVVSGGARLQLNSHRMIEEGVNINGNGFADPGETVKIPATLFNGGASEARMVAGRLRTVDPTQGRVVGPVAPYPDLPVGTAAESSDPHFALTLFEAGTSCGDTVELEIDMDAQDAATRSRRFELQLGSLQKDFVKVDDLPIPRVTQEPVLSTLEVIDDRVIGELDITVNISHSNPAELIVDLISPQNTTVRLHANSSGPGPAVRYDLEADPDGPGTMADFVGESTAGTWTLAVQDTLFGTTVGSIQGFVLHVTAPAGFDCDVSSCPEPTPAQGPDGLILGKTVDGGDGSVDLDFAWSAVGGAAGYHVLHSAEASFDARVDLTGRTDGATTLTVEDAAAATPAVTFFQVRAVNGCNQESP